MGPRPCISTAAAGRSPGEPPASLVVERALRDPRPHEVDIRLREEWTTEGHARTADAGEALELLDEITMVGIARGDFL